MYRGGAIALIDFLVERGANLEGVVNSRGWTPLRIADGVALDGIGVHPLSRGRRAFARAHAEHRACPCRPSSGTAQAASEIGVGYRFPAHLVLRDARWKSVPDPDFSS